MQLNNINLLWTHRYKLLKNVWSKKPDEKTNRLLIQTGLTLSSGVSNH